MLCTFGNIIRIPWFTPTISWLLSWLGPFPCSRLQGTARTKKSWGLFGTSKSSRKWTLTLKITWVTQCFLGYAHVFGCDCLDIMKDKCTSVYFKVCGDINVEVHVFVSKYEFRYKCTHTCGVYLSIIIYIYIYICIYVCVCVCVCVHIYLCVWILMEQILKQNHIYIYIYIYIYKVLQKVSEIFSHEKIT